MTWKFVTMTPSGRTITPEPRAFSICRRFPPNGNPSPTNLWKNGSPAHGEIDRRFTPFRAILPPTAAADRLPTGATDTALSPPHTAPYPPPTPPVAHAQHPPYPPP